MKRGKTDSLIVRKNHLNQAVFAMKNFNKGEIVTELKGKLTLKKDTPRVLKGNSDRFVQVGINKFLGPSGEIDDFINHSCNPNTILQFKPSGIFFVAKRNIKNSEEITWDYSTTLFNNPWKMVCRCGEKKCRKIISDFKFLSPKIQKQYYKLNAIPTYIKKYMESNGYMEYNKTVRVPKRYETIK